MENWKQMIARTRAEANNKRLIKHNNRQAQDDKLKLKVRSQISEWKQNDINNSNEYKHFKKQLSELKNLEMINKYREIQDLPIVKTHSHLYHIGFISKKGGDKICKHQRLVNKKWIFWKNNY